MEQNEKKPLIILTGPTAVGKTELSIELAKAVNGEILSADSMQVYRGMDIGTAKIKKEEMQGIPHYMIDELDPDEEFNVYIFQEKIRRYMTDIYNLEKFLFLPEEPDSIFRPSCTILLLRKPLLIRPIVYLYKDRQMNRECRLCMRD